MGMLNNTSARVTYSLDELIKIAYKVLVSKGEVPYTHPNIPTPYSPIYALSDPSRRSILNDEKYNVTFYLAEKKEEEIPSYEAGSWKEENDEN